MRFIFLTLLFALVTTVDGAVYYLSPQGDDLKGTGSVSSPWFTLKKAWKAVSAGDTIYLRGGTYAFMTMQDLTGKNGKAGKMIKICAFPGEKPVLTKTALYDMKLQTHLIYIDADYLHLQNLEIAYFEQKPGVNAASALLCYTSNSLFEGIDYHHNGLGMVIRGNSTGNQINNCDFHHNYDPYDEMPYNHADGLNISYIPSGTINTVKGCRFYNNADDGLDLWENEGSVVIDSCWAWKNGYREDGVTTGGDGAGFKMGKTSTSSYVDYHRIVTHNISAYNRMFGITQNAALCKMFICNNIFYGNHEKGIYFSSAWGDAQHVIKNNIAYNNKNDVSIGIKLPIIDHNSWQLESPLTEQCFICTDWTQLLKPRKPDGSLPDIDFLKPPTKSFLKDAGADVGLPYWGVAPDIGVHQDVSGELHINKLPLVSIITPTKGLSYTSPANVMIDVEASDPDGSVIMVELYNGNVKVGECNTIPYSFILKELPAGSYSLKAIATDNKGVMASSAIFNIRVNPRNEPGEFFNLYPNPNNGLFTVDFSSVLDADFFTIIIVDLIGKTVYREELSREESTRHFDLSYLNSGTYVLMISAKQILLTQKFIKG